MNRRKCPICERLRLVAAVIVLGAGSGFAALWLGASTDVSMLATFVGAIAPLMWSIRRRSQDTDPAD